ncbi:2772_t:CDS:10, partial [Funneliformis geosporum]
KQHNGVNNEDETSKESVSSGSNNSSSSSVGGLFRRPIQPTRPQNSSASIKSEDSGSKVDITLFENEDDEVKIEDHKENFEIEGLPEEIIEKLAKLKKYETKFPELVRLYKKLLNEKKTVEAVLRENTLLEGLSDVEALDAHLKNLNIKNNMSMEEIKRLTQIQDESKKQIEKMKETHNIESKSQSDLIDNLQRKLQEQEKKVEELRKQLSEKPSSPSTFQEIDSNKDDSANLNKNVEESSQEEVALEASSSSLSVDSQTSKLIRLEYETEMISLQKQLEEKLESLESSNLEDEIIKKVDPLNQKIQQLESEKSSLIECNTKFSNEISQLNKNIETSTKTQIDNEKKLKIEFEQKISQLENTYLAEKSKLEQTIEGLTNKNKSIKNELEITLKETQDLTEQHRMALDTKIKGFENERDLITKQFDKKLESAKLEIAKEKALLEDQLKAVTEKEGIAAPQQGEVAPDNEDWETKRLQFELQINSLQQEIEQLKQGNDSNKPSPSTEILPIQDQEQAQNKDADENQPDRAPINTEYDAITKEKDQLVVKVHGLIEELNLSTIRSQLNSANESILKLEQTRNEYRDKIVNIENAKGNLQKNLDNTITERENLSRERDELKSKYTVFSEQHDALKSDSTNMNKKLAELENRINELTKERDELGTSKENLIRDLEIVQKKANDFRAKTDDEMETMKSKLEITDKNYALLVSDVSRLHVAKTDALEKLSDVESRLKSLTQRERDVQESLTEAKSTIQKRDNEIEDLKKQQLEEEDKRNKSLGLLKKTQQKINILEKEKKDLSDEVERLIEAARIAEQNASSNLKQEITRFNKELTTKSTQITQLETLNEKLTTEKEKLFDQLQVRQAEFESSQSLLENLKHRSAELTHQLKEFEERSLTLEEELTSLKRLYKNKSRENETLHIKVEELDKEAMEKVGSLRKQVETYRRGKEKAELDLIEVKRTINSQIQDMANQLTAKDQATKRLENQLEEKDNSIKSIQQENHSLKQGILDIEVKMSNLSSKVSNADEKSANYRELEHSKERIKEEYEKMLEESRLRESTLRTMNKTLQEEVRKLHKMLDRTAPNSPQSPRNPSASTSSFNNSLMDDDTKILYIRDVILKFLEYKDRRKSLLPVLTTVLQLSDQEKRKLES